MKTVIITNYTEFSLAMLSEKRTPEMLANMRTAMYELTKYLPLFNPRLERFVVIDVAGYECVGYAPENLNFRAVFECVQPFDEKRVYPLQRIENKVDFVY